MKYVPNDHITVVKNPDYWSKTGVAHLDQVTFKPIADSTATLNALQSGDVDFAFNMNPTDIGTIQSDSKLTAIDRGESCNLFHLAMNQTHKPFDNPKIREAVALRHQPPGADRHLLRRPGDAGAPRGCRPVACTPRTRACRPTTRRRPSRSSPSPACPADQLTFDFWYPSDVFRPVHAGPEGHLPGHPDRSRGGRFQPDVGRRSPGATGTSRRRPQGSYPMWLIGWTCDWAGPDNFLDTAFF